MTAHENTRSAPAPARCSSCKASIVWVQTKGGKAAPFDAEPVADGAWQIDRAGVAIHVALGTDMFASPARYTSHFASCPAAKLHRKPR